MRFILTCQVTTTACHDGGGRKYDGEIEVYFTKDDVALIMDKIDAGDNCEVCDQIAEKLPAVYKKIREAAEGFLRYVAVVHRCGLYPDKQSEELSYLECAQQLEQRFGFAFDPSMLKGMDFRFTLSNGFWDEVADLRKIENKTQYQRAVDRVEVLLSLVENETSMDNPYMIDLVRLSNLVADYEEEHFSWNMGNDRV